MTDTATAEFTVQTIVFADFDTKTREDDAVLRELFLVTASQQVMGTPAALTPSVEFKINDKMVRGRVSIRAIVLGSGERPKHTVYAMFQSHNALEFIYDFDLPFSYCVYPHLELRTDGYVAYWHPDLKKHREMVKNWPQLVPA